MKKIVAVLLALLMCAASLTAFAELGFDFSQDEIKLDGIGIAELPEIEKDENARAATATDSVVNQDGVYGILTKTGALIVFDPRGLSFMTLTQDYKASYDVYKLFKDMETVQQYIQSMAEDDFHIIVWDQYDAFDLIALDTCGSDGLTQKVGNLNRLSENDIHTVASALAQANGLTSYDLYGFNNNIWIQLNAQTLVTIVNGEYQRVYFKPKGSSMTSEDFTDFSNFMRSLLILGKDEIE